MLITKLKFDLPKIIDYSVKEEILSSVKTIASCAFYLVGDDQMNLVDYIHDYTDWNIDEYNPQHTYEESVDNLVDTVGGYNQFIINNNLDEPQIQIIIDEEKTAMLNDYSNYKIYKVM